MKKCMIVTNIPDSFRTPDLRNFFSEFIEKGAFICFHFRHRPQAHLSDLRELLQKSVSGEKSYIGCEIKSNESFEFGRKPEDSPAKFKENDAIDISKKNNSSGMNCSENEKLSETEVQVQVAQDPNDNIPSSSNSGSKNLRGPVCRDVKSHWLNAGLSGLSSLIKEKKQKIKSDWRKSLKSSCVQDNNSNMNQEDGIYHISDMNQNPSHKYTEKDKKSALMKHRVFQEKTSAISLDDVVNKTLCSESVKRTCCILKIKDDFADNFVSKYNKKHWVDRTGEVLVPKCYLVKVKFEQTKNNGM